MSSQIKRALRSRGWMIRLTEWHEGFQACAFLRADIRKHVVTDWVPTETEAWSLLRTMVVEKERRMAEESVPPPHTADVHVASRSGSARP